jgi:hypothetical protein
MSVGNMARYIIDSRRQAKSPLIREGTFEIHDFARGQQVLRCVDEKASTMKSSYDTGYSSVTLISTQVKIR